MHSGIISKTRKEKSRKGARPRSRDPHNFWRTPYLISKTGRDRDLKFRTQTQIGNISRTRKEKSRKDAWPRSLDPYNFGVHPNVCPKRVELATWNLGHRCSVAISQKAAMKHLETGRGLGHVILANFGLPPNISAKRVELATWNLVHRYAVATPQKSTKKNLKRGRFISHVILEYLAYPKPYFQNL